MVIQANNSCAHGVFTALNWIAKLNHHENKTLLSLWLSVSTGVKGV